MMGTNQELAEKIKNYTNGFAPVVPYEKGDGLLLMDFTAANTALTDEILSNTTLFSNYVDEQLEKAGAKYGIGGYNEHRTIYSRSHVFDTEGKEPRRLHLGTDIWGPAGTPVYAPLAGTVHSVGYNAAFGDYGATLILQHDIEGAIFHTLYGHLSLHSIEEKKEGDTIEKGDWIAAFGPPAENGQWPPHLHFQLIIDMQGWRGDYPGVCQISEREKYLANCPNPDFILKMMSNAKK